MSRWTSVATSSRSVTHCEPGTNWTAEAVDGDALDQAVGAYLADRHHTATRP
ncbi:hypothetical protein OHB25_03640 [Streptomyces mirabilis]|uniref:hypothetical protein n=1 Tax=Streptomyces mirabilis TaxID=68239 RepID=UPI002E24E847